MQTLLRLVILICICSPLAVSNASKGPQTKSYWKLPSFQLTNSRGKSFSTKDMENKIWVVDFIFTSCPHQCPMLTKKMSQLQESFKKQGNKIQFVSISIDPETDTPKALLNYQAKHSALVPNWHFLTGSSKDINAVLKNGFKVIGADGVRTHSDRFVLIDGTGNIKGFYPVMEAKGLKNIKQEIQTLLN